MNKAFLTRVFLICIIVVFPVGVFAYEQVMTADGDVAGGYFGLRTAWVDVNAHGVADLVESSFVYDSYRGKVEVFIAVSYTPPSSGQGLRGYSIRIQADPEVSFTPGDILVNAVPSGATFLSEIIVNGTNDYTIDYTILGAGPGSLVVEDLFTVTCNGASTGSATFNIVSAELKDDSNTTIPAIHGAIAVVDCLPPDTPVLAAEPTFRSGTDNTINLSDQAASATGIPQTGRVLMSTAERCLQVCISIALKREVLIKANACCC